MILNDLSPCISLELILTQWRVLLFVMHMQAKDYISAVSITVGVAIFILGGDTSPQAGIVKAVFLNLSLSYCIIYCTLSP